MTQIDNLPGDVIDVAIQDQSTDIVDYYMCRQLFVLALAAPTVIDASTISVVSGASVVNGTYICIQEGARAFQSRVLSGGGTNTLTLDTPMDHVFTTAATINNRTPNLNVNGSVTPVSATIQPLPGARIKWDITRILISMTDDVQPDDGKFGGIPALTKGIVLRKTNGEHHTIFNAKTNADLKERMYDVLYADAGLPPAGTYGVSARRTFAGQDKNGVVIRLDSEENDMLEVLIQDDLSALNSFRIVAQGHLVED